MGHGVWCDQRPYTGPLPPTQPRPPPQKDLGPLPPTQPLPMAFEWDAAPNKSNKRRWRSYTPDLQRILNVGWERWKDIGEAACYYEFQIEQHDYVIDWNTMTQTNVATGYQRSIRTQPERQSSSASSGEYWNPASSGQETAKTAIHLRKQQLARGRLHKQG